MSLSTSEPTQIIQNDIQPSTIKFFACDSCCKTFPKQSLLIRHSSVHTKLAVFACHQCPLTFTQKTSLQRHLKKNSCAKSDVENKKTTYACVYCDRPFGKSSDRERHVKTHIDEKNFKCSVDNCTKAFRLKQTLERHEKTHFKTEFSCSLCLSFFSSEKVLNNHIQRIHEKTQHSETVIEIVLDTHEETVATTDEITQTPSNIKTNTCRACGKSFKKPIDLRRHVEAVHVRMKPFTCDYCRKSFSLKCTLNRHIQTHQSERMWVTCSLCSKRLSSKSSLRLHQRIHREEKPLQCSKCALSFRTPGNLQSHLRSRTHIMKTTALDTPSEEHRI